MRMDLSVLPNTQGTCYLAIENFLTQLKVRYIFVKTRVFGFYMDAHKTCIAKVASEREIFTNK